MNKRGHLLRAATNLVLVQSDAEGRINRQDQLFIAFSPWVKEDIVRPQNKQKPLAIKALLHNQILVQVTGLKQHRSWSSGPTCSFCANRWAEITAEGEAYHWLVMAFYPLPPD